MAIADEQSRFERFLAEREPGHTNDSGQGSASRLPEELRGLNWGALLLNMAWAVGMRLPIWYILAFFVPVVGMIMPLVLWVKGNEWAWQYRRWESVDHFRRVQERWAWWGLALLVAFVLVTSALVSWITHTFFRTITIGPTGGTWSFVPSGIGQPSGFTV